MTTETLAPRDVTGYENALALMPAYTDIPDEFKQYHNPYVKMTSQWFFKGINRSMLKAKPGVDASKAIRHLATIQQSFDPPHEHKTAGVAYLMSLWFDLA